MTPRVRDAAAWVRYWLRGAPRAVADPLVDRESFEHVRRPRTCICVTCVAFAYARRVDREPGKRLPLACYLPDPPLPLP